MSLMEEKADNTRQTMLAWASLHTHFCIHSIQGQTHGPLNSHTTLYCSHLLYIYI